MVIKQSVDEVIKLSLRKNGKVKKDPKETVRLKREIKLFSAVNYITGVMIGSGIFVTPSGALRRAGSVGMCLIVWLLCGVFSLLGALVFAELGSVVPKSGAEYVFFLEAYGSLHAFWGPLLGFVFVWISVLILQPSGCAVICLTFAEYTCQATSQYCGGLSQERKEIVKKLIALLALGLITVINCTSVKLYVKVQNVFTSLKLIACAIVIGVGAYALFQGKTENFSSPFEGSSFSTKDLALAFYSGFWAYDGWASITIVTEEIVRPEINILRSVLIAVPLVTAIYLMMNVAYMAVLTVPEILQAPAVAVLFGERTLGAFSFVIPLGVAISTFGGALSGQFGVARQCYVGGREGHMPKALSYINVNHLTPAPAVILQGTLTFIFIVSGNIDTLIDFTSFLIWIFLGAAMIAMIVLRYRKKDSPRPLKVPLIIPGVLALITAFLAIAPLVLESSPKYLLAIGIVLVAVLLYIPFIYYKKVPRAFVDKLTYGTQVLLQAVPPEKELD